MSRQIKQRKTTIGWLHLTDLHLGDEDARWLWPNVQDLFFKDLQFLYKYSGPWDIILFTGDLTNRGSEEEFRQVTEFFSVLRDKVQTFSPMPCVVAVPGNHDLVRPGSTRPEAVALRSWESSPELRKEFWSTDTSPYRRLINEMFANYTNWCAQSDLLGSLSFQAGLLPGDCSAVFQKDGVKVGVVGLNSTFLQIAKGDFVGKLSLDPGQLHHACGGDPQKWLSANDANILLTHHPPTFLSPIATNDFNSEIAPPGRFLIHLFGHMHEAVVRVHSSGQGEARRLWQGNSLFGLKTWGEEHQQQERRHGYSAGRLDVVGDTGLLTLWPRKLRRHPDGQWEFVPDYDSYSLRGPDNLSTRPETIVLKDSGGDSFDSGRPIPRGGPRKKIPLVSSKLRFKRPRDGKLAKDHRKPQTSFESSDVRDVAGIVDRHQTLLQKLGNEILDCLSQRPDPTRPMDARTLVQTLVGLSDGVVRNLTAEQIARLIDDAQGHGFIPGLVTGPGGFSVPVDHTAPRLLRNTTAKEQIANAAADLVQTGMRVALDGGSTNFFIAGQIIENLDLGLIRDVTLLTNSLLVARRFLDWFDKRGWTDQSAPMRLILCAGLVRPTTKTMAEPATDATDARDSLDALLKRLSGLDLCFIGANGLAVEHGITMPTTTEWGFKSKLMAASIHPYIVADAAKFGLHFPVQIADWNSRLTVLTNRPQISSPELEAVLAMNRSVDVVFA
jgi:DeoR/GlpR family transcriptional regulator of sugar metabolism